MMQPIKCQQCNASIPWDGVSVRLECPYCKTVYERQKEKRVDEQKKYLDENGNECLTGYYPREFNGSFQMRDQGNQLKLPCIEKPVKVYYEMSSQDGSAHILFITGSVYHHIDDTPQNRGRQNMLGSDLKRYRSYTGASGYADARFMEEHPQASHIRVMMTEQPRKEVQQQLELLRKQNAQNRMGVKYQNEFAGKVYGYLENGEEQICLVRLVTECLETPSMTASFGNMFGGLAAGLFGNRQSVSDITWSVCNEIYFWGSSEGVNRYWNEFERVYETIKTGPAFHQFESQIMQMFHRTNQQMANNAMRMAQAQMESGQRIGQMINDTNAYTMNLARQSFENTSAAMDRVNAMRSEAIRGVNSYSNGEDSVVEADVRFDRVYRNDSYSDLYAAAEGEIDMGSDWTILKKRY